MKYVASFTALSLALAMPAFSQSEADTNLPEEADLVLDGLTVAGAAGGAENVPGSISVITSAELDKLGHSDVLRALRVVPGVNIQEEEGYGLRPNIGLRGSGSDRSSRVVLMEDGIPIAPAVYSAPAAYYFPAMGRMAGVEVTKGPAVIQYGPRTTGGAVHLFSTPIPEESSGYAEILFGDYGRQRLHAHAGTRAEISEGLEAGFLIETFQDQADGFLERDSGGDTGFDIGDLVLKGALYGTNGPHPWSLELKYQTKDEMSEQTYLGLTQDDFEASPYRLYDATAEDVMDNTNEMFQLTGRVELSDTFDLTVSAYQNDVSRKWYKLQGVSDDGGGAATDRGISSILADPFNADGTLSDDYLLLTGALSLDDSLVVRANNRNYQSRGVQAVVNGAVSAFGFTHNLNAGIRLHEDSEDRLQDEDAYRLEGGRMFLTSAGAPGSNANRVTEAEAVSLFVLNRVEVTDRLQITGGLRFEDYEVSRTDFSTADPTRAAGPSRVRSTSADEVLPSLAALFHVNDQFALLGGIHKGYSPIGPTDTGVKEEVSWNYELGGRFMQDSLRVEAIAYLNAYENLLGECTNSTGSFCSAGDTFNGGEFEASGLEIEADWDAAEAFGLEGLSVPLGLAYTFTNTEFQTSFDNAFFGAVSEGDELNYVPEHQIGLSAGLTGDRWGVNTLVSYVSEARGTIGSGSVADTDVIDARTLVDVAAYFDLTNTIRLKIQAENLFDEDYIASRQPAGLRPGKPQEFLAGFALTF